MLWKFVLLQINGHFETDEYEFEDFVNVLNSMAGIGIEICLGMSFGISFSLIFTKKDKDKQYRNYVNWKIAEVPFHMEEQKC